MAAEGSAPAPDALDGAIRRLERAIAQLERRIEGRLAAAVGATGEATEQDRLRLAAELDLARARGSQLEAAAAAAARAIGEAASQIRAAAAAHTD